LILVRSSRMTVYSEIIFSLLPSGIPTELEPQECAVAALDKT
jgi:hypothetical protein